MEVNEQLVRWYNLKYIQPNEEGFYIINNNYSDVDFIRVSIGLWDESTKQFINHETERPIPKVSHWMPLPKPPEHI